MSPNTASTFTDTADFFEIDFLDVESAKSGDAIVLRYLINGLSRIHVVDGGYQDTGDKVIEHLQAYYENPPYIDRVIVSHPDGDHAGGLRRVLEHYQVLELWMLRPWVYANEIIDRFATYSSVERLTARLKQIYPNLAALEEIAIRRGIPIKEPFQGETIGMFHVMAPTKERYLDCIVNSERTPESVEEAEETVLFTLEEAIRKAAAKVVNLLKAGWGYEVFSTEETSAENEMSVIQYANLCGEKILLTADAGREALTEAADYAPSVGLTLPGIDRFQVPHHGSRRNVSSEILDRWLGPKLPEGNPATFTAIISSAKKDEHHPRKAVVRALYHRGANVLTTEGNSIRTSRNAQARMGWNAAIPVAYPDEIEN